LLIWLSTIDLVIDGVKLEWLGYAILIPALLFQIADLVLKIGRKLKLSKKGTLKSIALPVLRDHYSHILTILLISLKLGRTEKYNENIFNLF